MVARQKKLSFFSIVVWLWGWTELTSTEVFAMEAVAADGNVEQHRKSLSALPANPGRFSSEERVPNILNIESIFDNFFKTFKRVSLSIGNIARSKLPKRLISNRILNERARDFLDQANDKSEAVHILFDQFNVGDETLSLAENSGFQSWYSVVNSVFKDKPLESDRLVFAELKTRFPSLEIKLTGSQLDALQLIEFSVLRKFYDAVKVDEWIFLDRQPVIDLTPSSACSEWFDSKVMDEEGDAIVLILNTMKSKAIPDEFSVLETAAREANDRFSNAIKNHKARVDSMLQEVSQGVFFSNLFSSRGLEEVMESGDLVHWIDYYKLLKLNNRLESNSPQSNIVYEYNMVLVGNLKKKFPLSEIAKQFRKSRQLQLNLAMSDPEILHPHADIVGNNNLRLASSPGELHRMTKLYSIRAYDSLLQSWKNQGKKLRDVADILGLDRKSDNDLNSILYDYATYLYKNPRKAKKQYDKIVYEFTQYRRLIS